MPWSLYPESTLPSIVATLRLEKRGVKSPGKGQREQSLYAPVDSAELLPAAVAGGEQILRIRGRFPLMFIGCMKLKEVMVNAQKEILVVQPTAEIVDDPQACGVNRTDSFEVEVPFDRKLPSEFLVHVRSLNGASYNRHFERAAAELSPQQ